MEKVKNQKNNIKNNSQKKKPGKNKERSKGIVIIPYVHGLSESVDCVFRKHKVQTAMRLHTTIKKLLFHPKGKRGIKETSGVVYSIECKNCNNHCIGETGRNFGYS